MGIAKVNSPQWGSKGIEALWKGSADGMIDTIRSDHCTFLKEDKAGLIWDASAGFPGSATMLAAILSEGVNKKRISLGKVVEVISYNPARIFNLFPRKGTIQAGSDADLCIVDLSLSKKVRHEDLLSCFDFSVFEGLTLKGWPVMTMVRGKMVMREG